MQQPPYADFVQLSEKKQHELVQSRKQGPPHPFPEPAPFPETNFLQLQSQQLKTVIRLVTYRHQAANPRAVVVLLHNLGLSTSIMGSVAEVLAQQGYTVVGFDQRGHGKSEGERGYIDDHELMLNDTYRFITKVFDIYGSLPVFVLGHGLGSLLALIICQQHRQLKLAGLILTSTTLKKPAMSAVLMAISDIALKIVPNRTGLFPWMYDLVTSNPSASSYLENHPQIFHQKVYAGTLNQLGKLMQRISENRWGTISTPPVMFVQGQYDKIADPINTIRFFEDIRTQDRTMFWYRNLWNCFFFEPEADDVYGSIISWLKARS